MLKVLYASLMVFLLAAWAVGAPPVLTLPSSVNGTVNTAFSWQISASNTPTFYTASGLPPGVVLNRLTGLVSGTPKAAGTFTATVAAANAAGTSFAPSGAGKIQTVNIIVAAGSSSATSPVTDNTGWTPYVTLTLGTPFSQAITATNTDSTSRYVLSGSLPPGITLQGNIISGTPTQTGLYVAEVGVTNLFGFVPLPVVFFVPMSGGSGTGLVLSTPNAVAVDPSDFFEVFVPASGEVTEFTAGPLPPGVFLEIKRGRIYGNPSIAGTWPIVVSARGPAGWAQPVVLSLQVNNVPTFYSGSLLSKSTVQQGTSVGSISITTSNTPLIPYTLSVSGLPPGLVFQSPNSITGTPTQAGFFTPSVTLIDSRGTRLRIAPLVVTNPGAGASVVAAPGNQAAVRWQPFSLQLSASGTPTGFYAYGLPPGVSVNPTTGLISGTPTLDGSYYVVVASANALGPSQAVTFTINVQDDYALPPVVAGGGFAGGQAGQTFTYDPQAASGLAPGLQVTPTVTFSATSLPPGISIDAQTGLLSGVPTTAGTYLIDYQLTGQFGETRFRVTARIAPNQWTTQSLGTGSSSSAGIWQAGDRYALELSAGSVIFSTDGQNWSTPVTVANDGATLNGFAYGAGKYVFSSAGSVYVSTDLVTWTRQALPVTTGCQGLIFAAGQFVLAQNYAFAPALLVSSDAVTWTLKPLTLTYPAAPVSIAYGNGVFVCTTTYSGPVLVSSTGDIWETIQPSPALNGPVAFSVGGFVIMTGNGATSVDGRSWQFKALNADSPLSPVAIAPFGQGFLVTAAGGTLYASLDGLNWRKLLTLSSSFTLQGLATGLNQATLRYRNGSNVFVNSTPGRWLFPTSGPAQFICQAGTTFQQTFCALPTQTGLLWHAAGLPDGLTLSATGELSGTPITVGSYQAQLWAEDALGLYEPIQVSFDVRATTGQSPQLRGLPYLADATLATSYTATLPLQTDGLNAVTSISGLPRGLTYDPASRTISGKPLQVGSFNALLVATDSYGGGQWSLPLRVRNGSLTTTYSALVLGLAWNGTTYVAVGDTSTGYINVSTDGVNWSLSLQNTSSLPLAGLNAIAWGAGKFVVVGNTGTLLTSADGSQWQRVTLGTTANLRSVTYGGGRWVAVGASGVAVTSTDAATWQVIATGATATFNGIGYDGSAFFAVGDSGTIRKSTDGSTWSTVTSGTTRTLYALAYGAGRYVVGTTNGDVLVSTNGAAWSLQSLGYTSNASSAVRSLIYKTGYGFALNFYDNTTSSNRFLRSTDGLSWTASAGYAGNAQSLLVSDDLVLVGDGTLNKIRVFSANAAPEITSATAAVAYPGVAFYYDVAPWGLTTPLTAVGLPSGLTLDTTTGTISGTPQTEGVYDVEITSSGTQPAHLSLKLSVLAGTPSFITTTSGNLELRITRGDTIDWAIPVIHPADSWRSSTGATLPSGLSFDYNTGHIVGRATQSGVFGHQFYATNALGDSLGTLMIYVSDPLPVISSQPAAQSIIAGGAATFSVETSLTSSVRFQWFCNGQPVVESSNASGTRTSVLHLTGVQPADAGNYDVVVANGTRSELSISSSLTVRTVLADYHAWVGQHVDVLGTTGTPLDTPLGDRVSNLLRYALGLPLTPVPSADYLVTTTRDSLLVLSYVRPAGLADITYSVEGSRDLKTWSILGVDHHRVVGDTGVEWEAWEATYSLSSQSRGFLRLRIDPVTP